jgi:YD repeat-containing protein
MARNRNGLGLRICLSRLLAPLPLKLTLALILLACLSLFSSTAAAQSTPSMQGVWTGTRNETSPPSGLPADSIQTFTLYQTSPGGAVVGTVAIYWPTTSYYWSGSASGTISGSTISLTFTPEIVNLPSGASACAETESLPISSSGGVTTMVMPSYNPCGSGTSTINSYTLTLSGWQHLGCSPCGAGPQSGIPIDPSTGNVTDTETDYTTSGQNPLAFTRYYNSFQPPLTYAGGMGTQWRTNYDRYLQLTSSSVVIAERPNGNQIIFTLVGSTWTPPTDVDMTLTNSGSTWTLTGHDDSVESYSAAGSVARLSSITLRNGYTQSLTYNTSAQLTSVTDSYSRSLSLSYTSGLLTQVTTPDSLVLTYGYNTGGTLLTSVSYNTSPTTSVTYNYANSSIDRRISCRSRACFYYAGRISFMPLKPAKNHCSSYPS